MLWGATWLTFVTCMLCMLTVVFADDLAAAVVVRYSNVRKKQPINVYCMMQQAV